MITRSIDLGIKSEVFNMDCMEGMKSYPDKYFELAIVDPPFGIGENWKKDSNSPFKNHTTSYKNIIPGPEYFQELFRVSKDQIIWGANYYWNYLAPSNNLIFWDKYRDPFVTFNSAGELAWTSLTHVSFSKASFMWNGAICCEKRTGIHPHEKPVDLYKWLLKNYATTGDKILDTHMGSQSSRIAAFDMKFDYYGFELDSSYFDAGNNRFEQYKAQLKLF